MPHSPVSSTQLAQQPALPISGAASGLADPVTGQDFGIIQKVDAGGTASYNGLLLSVQRPPRGGVTLSGNYTWSACISDLEERNEHNERLKPIPIRITTPI